MTLITAPTFLKVAMENANFRLERTDFQMRSAFTNQRQVLAWHSGHMWVASCSVPNLEEPESGLMRAFLAKMRGRVNTVQFPVPGYRGPSNGYAGSAGAVMGADQTGYSLDTDGWATSQTVLPEGSFITVNGELKLLTAPLVTDGSGEGTLTFEPALRIAPDDNAPIVINDPYAVMSMSDSSGAGWSLRAPRFHGFDLMFEEAVDV